MFRELADFGNGLGAFASEPFPSSAVPSDSHIVSIKKADDEQQLVFGEVYAPGVPDSHGDFMTRESIREMAYEFMRKGFVNRIDVNHNQQESGCYVVESFIARDDDPVFIPGSWVIGVKCTDEVWDLVKSGELNGFSFDGVGFRVENVIEIDLPEILEGETDEANGHTHKFWVRFDADGNFLGGCTDEGPDGSKHRILRGTVTEEDNGHAHRFSFVEGILNAQVAY